ncbi:MAG: class I SAM-dependent methyltransferase [Thermoprotei archaeon]
MKDRYIPTFLLNNPLRGALYPRGKVLERFSEVVYQGDKVLDEGAGPGFFTKSLLELVGQNGLVYAVDPNPASIDSLKKIGAKNLRVFLGSAGNLHFLRDEEIDFAFSNLVLCCMGDPLSGIKELNRVVKEGGYVYASVSKGPFGMGELNQAAWRKFLGCFELLKSGGGLTEEWALLKKPS